MKMFRKKIVNEVGATGTGLAKVLGRFDLTMNGIAAIIGAGVFVLIGDVITKYSGPGVWLSFLFAGIAASLVALAYAELAGMIPSSGSSYAFAYATLGEGVAFLIGWSILLAYGVAISAVASGIPGYLNEALPTGWEVPAAYSSPPDVAVAFGTMIGVVLIAVAALGFYRLRGPASAPGWQKLIHGGIGLVGLGLVYNYVGGITSMNLVASATILLLTVHQWHGVKESARLNSIFSIIEGSLVAVFIALAIFNVKAENLTPIAPFGWLKIGKGTLLIFLAFIGFESLTGYGSECRNAKKDMPFAILTSTAVCTVLYMLAGVGVAGVVSYLVLDAKAPMAHVLRTIGYGEVAVGIFSVCVLISIKSTLIVLIGAVARLAMTMAGDGLLPPRVLATIDQKHRTPSISLFTCGAIAAVAGGLFAIGNIGELIVVGVLTAFTVVCAGVIILRYTHPDMPRGFRCPLVPFLPGLGALVCVGLIATSSSTSLLIFGGWLVVGALVYLVYGRKHSTLNDEASLA